MKVTRLVRKTDASYEVFLDETPYILQEETILEYRLLEGREVDCATLSFILAEDELQKLSHKALGYALRYGKSEQEVVRYLEAAGALKEHALEVVSRLCKKKKIDEEKLACAIAGSLARNANGPRLIQQKLKTHLFKEASITTALDTLLEEDIAFGMNKLRTRLEKKYQFENDFVKQQKIKKAFYQHGYLSSSF